VLSKIAIGVAVAILLITAALLIDAGSSCSPHDAEGPKLGDVIPLGGCYH
jgi:hypothetical protein